MRIVEKKGRLFCVYNKNKEKDLTWRKVRDLCNEKIKAMRISERAKKVEHFKVVISYLQSYINSYENELNRYTLFASLIKDDDEDMDKLLSDNAE